MNKIESNISSIPRPLPEATEEQTLSLTIPTDQRITPSDNFFIYSMYYSGTQGYIEITYRLLKPDGNIIGGILTNEILRLNDATLKTTIISPALEGSLISLTARFYGASITLGTCYVQVGLFLGSNATTGQRLTVFIAGYLNTVKCLSYPANRAYPPYSNSNHQRFLGSFSGALPYYLTPPAYTRWKNMIFYCSVTTSAVAANRNFYVELEHTAGLGGGMFMSPVQ